MVIASRINFMRGDRLRSLLAQPTDDLMLQAGSPSETQVSLRWKVNMAALLDPARRQRGRRGGDGRSQSVQRDQRIIEAGDDQRWNCELMNDRGHASAEVIITRAREPKAGHDSQFIPLRAGTGPFDRRQGRESLPPCGDGCVNAVQAGENVPAVREPLRFVKGRGAGYQV